MRVNHLGLLVVLLLAATALSGCFTSSLIPKTELPNEPYNLVADLPYTIPEGALEPHTNWPDDDRSKLTDGAVLPPAINHNHATFKEFITGFLKAGAKGLEVNLEFDLTEAKEVHQVRFSAYSYHTTSYTYFYPDQGELFGSTDGENWEPLASFTNPVPRDDQRDAAENGSRWFDIELDTPAVARYIKIDLITLDGTSYMFLDEIEVLGFDPEEQPTT